MDQNNRKHLEFIQDIVKRMSGNSFLLRGWSITVITAVIAFAIKTNHSEYLIIAWFLYFIFIISAFFFLDLILYILSGLAVLLL